MSKQWLEKNSRYLAQALALLRLRLEYQAAKNQTEAALSIADRHRQSNRPNTREIDEAITAAENSLREAETAHPDPPALLVLAERLGLTPFESEVLLLCAAMELDTGIGELCALAQGQPDLAYPTFALSMVLFDNPSWDALSPERPLRHYMLIEIARSTGQPLLSSLLRADERIVNYIKGLSYLDDRLAGLVAPLDLEKAAPLAPSQQAVVEKCLAGWEETVVIQLAGPDSYSKRLVAYHAGLEAGRQLYRLPVEGLSAIPAELENLARLWERESKLKNLALLLDLPDGEGTPEMYALLNRFLNRTGGFYFLSVLESWPRLWRHSITLEVAKPTQDEQFKEWSRLVGKPAPDSPGSLAAQFDLNLAAIRQIAGEALAGKKRELAGNLWDACCAMVRPRMDNLAQRLIPQVSWDDLVLPAPETLLLHQISNQVPGRNIVYNEWGFGKRMSRGLGINVLFAGPSGTGKTLAAEVISAHLRLNLYRIDLASVVNKYIGETEKNLRRLFDAAEEGGVLLFFDEADALFGKRSEVKDSHDRYANIEINYLLQRLEAYKGLAILATNNKSAIDPAFLRRLRYVVNFPFPGPEDRKRVWQKVFPPGTPLAELDYDRLARLHLTGGNIATVALNAAFVAAHAEKAVDMEMVMEAARIEYQKLDRPINEADFRWDSAKSRRVS